MATNTQTVNYLPYANPNDPTQLQNLTQQAAQVNQPAPYPVYQAPIAPVPQVQPSAVQPVASGYTPQAGTQQVLQATQQKALQGAQSQLMPQTAQLTQQLLQQPSQGINTQQQTQRALEAYDVQRAQGFQQAMQAAADTAQHGETINQLLDIALAGGRERAQYQTELEAAAEQQQYSRLLEAINQGRLTAEQERLGYQTDIGALTSAMQVAEGTEQRALTAAEAAAERGTQLYQQQISNAQQLAVQSRDFQFQDHLARLQGNIERGLLTTQQDFEALQNDLNRQLQIAMQQNDIGAQINILQMQQQFQGIQADLDRKNRVEIQKMVNEQDQWKTMRAETLTRAGWDFEAAQATADREHSLFMQEYDAALQKELQGGAQQFEAEQAAQQRAMLVSEANLDRLLTREVEAGKLSIAEKELAQQAYQFESAQDFEMAMAAEGYDQAAIARAWEANQNALDRSFEMEMQYIQQEFAREGVAWDLVAQQLQNMDGEQAALFIKQTYENTIFDRLLKQEVETGNLSIAEKELAQNAYQFESVQDFGEAMAAQGYDQAAIARAWDANQAALDSLSKWKLPDFSGVKTEQAAQAIGTYQATGGTMSQSQVDAIMNYPEKFPNTVINDTGYTIESMQTAAWTTDGMNRWALTGDARAWVSDHKGDLYPASNGHLYEVVGISDPTDRHSTGGIIFKDVQTGQQVIYTNSGGGGGSNSGFPQMTIAGV